MEQPQAQVIPALLKMYPLTTFSYLIRVSLTDETPLKSLTDQIAPAKKCCYVTDKDLHSQKVLQFALSTLHCSTTHVIIEESSAVYT